MNKLNRYLCSNGVWLPLSAFIFIVYVVQRGFSVVAKSGMVPDYFPRAMMVYFIAMSLGCLVSGFLLDRFRAKDVLLLACLFGGFGIMGIVKGPFLFGLLFGSAASIIKLAPFTAQLKAIDATNEGIKVAPQSAAKNFGGAAFMLFLGALIVGFTFQQLAITLGFIMIAVGIYSYKLIPDANLTAWRISDIVELIKMWQFWVMMVYFFLMCGFNYWAVAGLFPGLTNLAGFTKETAIFILAGSYLLAAILRWPAAWIGQKVGLWWTIWIGTIGLAVTIWITPVAPFTAVFWFAVFGSVHTPNYWALSKKVFGKAYLSTVVGLGFVFMYLGAGIMCEQWME